MIIEYLNAIYPMSDGLTDYLLKVVSFQKVKKKQFLLRQGQVSRHIYIIWKGIVRCYYTMEDGKEVSARFMLEGNPVAPILSFFQQVESYESLVALEDCELYALSYEDMEYARRIYLEFNFIAFELIRRNYLQSEERLLMIRCRTADERLAFLKERWPQLLERVPKKLIASYIDLTPSVMSRKAW
jgi:CRP-like cAMP-binding protein